VKQIDSEEFNAEYGMKWIQNESRIGRTLS
jgi:hypothetical protein